MKKNIFVISTIFLGIVVVALLFTIATLQSENSDCNQANQIDTTTMLQLEVCMLMILCLDRSNTKIQVNMNK